MEEEQGQGKGLALGGHQVALSSRRRHCLQPREGGGLGVDWGLWTLGKHLSYRANEGGREERRAEAGSRGGVAKSRGGERKGINETKGETGHQNLENVLYFVWLCFGLLFT